MFIRTSTFMPSAGLTRHPAGGICDEGRSFQRPGVDPESAAASVAVPDRQYSHLSRTPDLLPYARPAARFAVIVMGVSGCGKSTLGASIAEALHCPFLEGDDFHSAEAIAKMRGGQPLSDEDRWPWLDRIGTATARSIAEHGAAVIACSALRLCYRDRLRATIGEPVQLVLLENSRERLLERLLARAGHFMPAGLLDSQLATLERPGAAEDALMLLSEEAPALLRERVLARLQDRRLRSDAPSQSIC
jgi:gluconokinase